MFAKIRLQSDLGPLNSNMELVFAHLLSIASLSDFSLSSNPGIGNTLNIGKNKYNIRIHLPKITMLKNSYFSEVTEMPVSGKKSFSSFPSFEKLSYNSWL